MAPCVQDHTVQHFGHAIGIAHLLLIADHVLEQGHLLHFLETPLPDRPVRRLRRDQQKRRMVPIGRLHRRHEIGDARPVLRDHHAHPARSAGEAVRHHAARSLMRAVPEGDARLGEQVRNRHEGRSDDAEGIVDAMHLQHLHESLFRRHPHGSSPPGVIAPERGVSLPFLSATRPRSLGPENRAA